MNLMDWIYLLAVVAMILIIVQVVRQWLRRRNDYALL